MKAQTKNQRQNTQQHTTQHNTTTKTHHNTYTTIAPTINTANKPFNTQQQYNQLPTHNTHTSNANTKTKHNNTNSTNNNNPHRKPLNKTAHETQTKHTQQLMLCNMAVCAV
jgi:hypothetical protein